MIYRCILLREDNQLTSVLYRGDNLTFALVSAFCLTCEAMFTRILLRALGIVLLLQLLSLSQGELNLTNSVTWYKHSITSDNKHSFISVTK